MSEQTEVKACCVTGHLHDGTPLGSMEVIHGLETYVSNPKTSRSGKTDTIIMIPDIFGIYVNAKLLCDDWAGQGYRVLMPDLMANDAVSIDQLNRGIGSVPQTIAPNMRVKAQATMISKAADTATTAATLGPWMFRHREAGMSVSHHFRNMIFLILSTYTTPLSWLGVSVTLPILEKFVQGVRGETNTGKIGAIGFCWGGRYAMLLAQEKSPAQVDAIIQLDNFGWAASLEEADVKEIKSVPCAIFLGTQDDMVTVDKLAETEKIMRPNLGDKLHTKTYQDGVHGFTIRGDATDGHEKAIKEEANNDAMKFLAKWLEHS
ncbi:MAG: hypothetical protein TREMPRED_004893 [Tremellales sp. Tagirdzhanova-0007]|nr:MAG: hypothetical protein TREMPRED_004893 [Tremellales sp. Tagirdzhanova-0007]